MGSRDRGEGDREGERVNQKDCSEYFERFFQLMIILKVTGNAFSGLGEPERQLC